eukprot:267063-Amphidinium_carterae.2
MGVISAAGSDAWVSASAACQLGRATSSHSASLKNHSKSVVGHGTWKKHQRKSNCRAHLPGKVIEHSASEDCRPEASAVNPLQDLNSTGGCTSLVPRLGIATDCYKPHDASCM